jgi:PAS domain S-box-containing protein
MQEDRFIECNQSALDMLGISEKKLFIGSSPLDISPEYQPDGRLSAEAAPDYIAKAHREGHFRFEWMVRRVDGTAILLEVSLLPIMFKGEEMLHITWRDITERKQLDNTIRESERQLRAILDATPFPVALVDIQDNGIYYWSRSALTLFGHVAPTAPEWYQIAYPDPDYRQEVIDRWKPFLEMAKNTNLPVNTGEYEVTCKDGTVRICELYATFLPDKLIVTFNVVTERKKGRGAPEEGE